MSWVWPAARWKVLGRRWDRCLQNTVELAKVESERSTLVRKDVPPATYPITLFRMNDDFLIDSFATPCFTIGARRGLDELVATGVLVNDPDTHIDIARCYQSM